MLGESFPLALAPAMLPIIGIGSSIDDADSDPFLS
jgi:hypothetical protein